jgi:hypothetical protein
VCVCKQCGDEQCGVFVPVVTVPRRRACGSEQIDDAVEKRLVARDEERGKGVGGIWSRRKGQSVRQGGKRN